MPEFIEKNPHEEKIAQDTLERYSGSEASSFQRFLLLTNFSRYLRTFAETNKVAITEGSMFRAAHAPELEISILDFTLGSPAAALVVDLCSFLPQIKAALLLGMCGGLRKHYKIGSYFVPIASIRGEGTSDFYFPREVPAMSNFLLQKAVSDVLESDKTPYHIGITHTTNIRFWEFNEGFIAKLIETKAQAIEMECATLFAAAYRRQLPLGALLLISDLPLTREGIKTKQSANLVFDSYTRDHLMRGIKSIEVIKDKLQKKEKGAYREMGKD